MTSRPFPLALLGAGLVAFGACGTPGGGGSGGFPLPDGFVNDTAQDTQGQDVQGDSTVIGPDADQQDTTGPGPDATTTCTGNATRCAGDAVEMCVGGQWGPGVPCGEGANCQNGQCVPDVCTPSCAGADCGSDGCGGSCGTCDQGESCIFGMCQGGCVGSCSGKVCGDDGCGNSCGQCTGGTTCVGGVCQGGCTPSCSGKECGSNGCGGTCGTCPSGWLCDAGVCEQEACVPSCAGKQCGSNGCGGTCGSCTGGTTCSAGQCVGGTGVGCDVLFDCMQQCETEACADACAAEASQTGLNEYSGLLSCLQANACADLLCVADFCATPWALCFNEGTGFGSCSDIWSCQGGCGTDPDCPQECVESGSSSAQGDFTAVLLCINQMCPGGDSTCVNEELNGTCSFYVGQCLQ